MNWWQRLLRRRKMEEQLEKELRFHLEQHANELIAQGCNPQEARRQARLAIGGPEQVKENCRDARGTRLLEDLLQDTRYALRTFRQKPGFTLVALLILSLGIGATTVMFAVINSVLLRPLSYPEPDRLVTLRGFTEAFGEFWGCSNLDFVDAKHESQTLALAAWTYGGGTISEPGEPEYVNRRQISAELFSTLGNSPVQGRVFRPDEDRPGAAAVAIISYGLWQRDFGGAPSAIGRSLVYDGTSYTVVGIAPAGFQLPRGFTRAGACHACGTGGWAWPPGASMPYRKRNVRPWRRPARRCTRLRQHSPICFVLARQLAAGGRGPSGLARSSFRRVRLALEPPSFRAGAGAARYRARRRTDAPGWGAKHRGKLAALAQRICNL